jgi:hypothetical protein
MLLVCNRDSGREETAMTTSTLAVTINVAFFLEIREENKELDRLISDCRAAAAKIEADSADLRQLMDLLGNLRDNVAMQFALEEAYGYFENPTVRTPDLSANAVLLRDEHWILYSDLTTVIEHVEQRVYREPSDETTRQLARDVVAFCDNFQYHDTQEHALVMRMQESDSLDPPSLPEQVRSQEEDHAEHTKRLPC